MFKLQNIARDFSDGREIRRVLFPTHIEFIPGELTVLAGPSGSGKTTLLSIMGFEAEAHRIQDLFFEGKRDEAIPLVPTQFADEISLVGSKERIRDRLAAWKESPVTTIILNGDLDTLRTMAELVG